MLTAIACLTAWIPIAFLFPAILRSASLDTRATTTGRVAEILGWGAWISTLAAIFLWMLAGQTTASLTLTGAGYIGVRLDALSLVMLCLVSFLGAIIMRFSRNYLAGDERQGYFFKWILFTLGAVLSLCLSPGLFQFWLSWVASSIGLHRLLVYFPDRLGTLLSARKKFVVSRLGDLCLVGAFGGIYLSFGTQNFTELFAAIETQPGALAGTSWIGWLIVAGALLKSAQFPFHTWLPDTMGTPTPVSALMHAGIINAGGYLVIRMSPLLINMPSALTLLALAGAATAVCGSLIMLTQTGVKRALAFSTIAQMGFMMLQCGLGAFSLAVLHLVAHSLYKAHAFLSSGSTVATINRLEEKPKATAPAVLLPGIAVLSLGLLSGLVWTFRLQLADKPGLIVLGMVMAMAVTQLLWGQLRQGLSLPALVRGTGLVLGFVVLYLALAKVAGSIFSSVLPVQQIAPPAFQVSIGLVLYGCFLLSIAFQEGMNGLLPERMRNALYVHALNGFYFNTIANRISRSLGLVPPGR